jgi:putative flippase GtrA
MKPFDYVSILLSFVISLIFAQILTGISRMIQSGVRRPSIPATYWIGFVLFLSVDYWFSIWGLRNRRDWSFAYVSLQLLFCSLLFLVARATVPDTASDAPIDMTALYERDRRRIMVLFLMFSLCGTAVNLTLPGFATSELLAIAVTMMTMFAIAWRWSALKVQLSVVVLHAALMTYYVIRYVPLLS